ncbi:MAG: hypothetical protein ACR2NN_14895 [Bryobacteraceae bacterium]
MEAALSQATGQKLKPRKSAYGLLAKYGPGLSEEEIDKNRRDMFRGFAEGHPVIAGVADTHAALWYLLKNPRLSNVAREFMDNAASAGDAIALSAISLAEIVYLVDVPDMPDDMVAPRRFISECQSSPVTGESAPPASRRSGGAVPAHSKVG